MDIIYGCIAIAIIICLFLVWFFSHRASHQERMLRIEMGIQPEQKKGDRQSVWIKIAFLLGGLGVALLLISILVSLKMLDSGGNALPLALIGICGGVSMLLANRYTEKKNRQS